SAAIETHERPSSLHHGAPVTLASKVRLIRHAVDGLTRSSRRETCTADHLLPRAARMPRASNPAAMARNDSQPAACRVSARSPPPGALARWAALPAARAFAVSLAPDPRQVSRRAASPSVPKYELHR